MLTSTVAKAELLLGKVLGEPLRVALAGRVGEVNWARQEPRPGGSIACF